MAVKFKMFCRNAPKETLEDIVNKWLEENQNIEIIDSHFITNPAATSIVFAILYTTKPINNYLKRSNENV